jgi:hypothetical protein
LLLPREVIEEAEDDEKSGFIWFMVIKRPGSIVPAAYELLGVAVLLGF